MSLIVHLSFNIPTLHECQYKNMNWYANLSLEAKHQSKIEEQEPMWLVIWIKINTVFKRIGLVVHWNLERGNYFSFMHNKLIVLGILFKLKSRSDQLIFCLQSAGFLMIWLLSIFIIDAADRLENSDPNHLTVILITSGIQIKYIQGGSLERGRRMSSFFQKITPINF